MKNHYEHLFDVREKTEEELISHGEINTDIIKEGN